MAENLTARLPRLSLMRILVAGKSAELGLQLAWPQHPAVVAAASSAPAAGRCRPRTPGPRSWPGRCAATGCCGPPASAAPAARPPGVDSRIELTGNMGAYSWGFNGQMYPMGDEFTDPSYPRPI
jgi:hypothetical protein